MIARTAVCTVHVFCCNVLWAPSLLVGAQGDSMTSVQVGIGTAATRFKRVSVCFSIALTGQSASECLFELASFHAFEVNKE